MQVHELDQLPNRFYHGTSTHRLNAIVRNGLVPQPQRDNPGFSAVYLTDDRLVAGDYIELAIDRYGGNPVILAVNPADLDLSALMPDDGDLQQRIEDMLKLDLEPGETLGAITGVEVDERLIGYRHWSEVPWRLSLAVTRQVAYTKVIPISSLKRLRLG